MGGADTAALLPPASAVLLAPAPVSPAAVPATAASAGLEAGEAGPMPCSAVGLGVFDADAAVLPAATPMRALPAAVDRHRLRRSH